MKFLIYISIVVVLSTMILSKVFDYYKKGKSYSQSDFTSSIEEMVYGKEDYDILFLGSSRTLLHVNPYIIDSITKLNSFNAGISGANLLEMNLMLQCYLKKRQPPKLVVLDLSVNAFDIEKRPISNILKYTSVIEDNLVYETLRHYNNTLLLKYMPFFLITDDDDETKLATISSLFRKNFKDSLKKKEFKGYCEGNSDTIVMPFRGFKTNYFYNISQNGIELLSQVITTCKTLGVSLLFTYSPEYFVLKNDYHMFFEFLKKNCADNNIPFLNYQKSSICYDHRLFSDPIHLNKYGSDKFSTILAHEIIKQAQISTSEDDPF